MKQFAIKREFETFVVHSDKSRYRAKCVNPECEWKVHAKKLLRMLYFHGELAVFSMVSSYFYNNFI